MFFIVYMPIHNKKDNLGSYYIWGFHGKKYYYNSSSKRSQKIAYNKAVKQAQAAHANGYSK